MNKAMVIGRQHTSRRCGRNRAPRTVQVSVAIWAVRQSADTSSTPCATSAANAPCSTSPAPFVSRASTGSMSMDPFVPSCRCHVIGSCP